MVLPESLSKRSSSSPHQVTVTGVTPVLSPWFASPA
jgi:hypothetical protein